MHTFRFVHTPALAHAFLAQSEQKKNRSELTIELISTLRKCECDKLVIQVPRMLAKSLINGHSIKLTCRA